MKNLTVRAVVLAVALCAVLATAVCGFLYFRFGREAPAEMIPPAAYTLGAFDGRLAVFEGDSRFPMKLYDVAIVSLPAEEQQRLAAGIPVSDKGALERLLEDYTS